jgi:DNA-binding transcriptional LysR family regulator
MLIHVESMAGAAAGLEPVTPSGSSGLSGVLRISVSEGFGSWFLARHAPDFTRRHPNLTIDLVANSGFLSLSKREADMAVMLSRPRAGPVIARKLSDYTLQLFASPAYLAERGTPVKPTDLASGHQLVGYIPDLIYAPELRYLDEIQPGLAPHIRSSSINAQHQLIASGAGIGVLPSFIGKTDPSLRTILAERRIVRSFWLVSHNDTHQLARVRAGRQWITEIAQRHCSELIC